MAVFLDTGAVLDQIFESDIDVESNAKRNDLKGDSPGELKGK